MTSEATRDGALIELNDAFDQFNWTIEAIPTDALAYLKPGDDYALGGLVIHVSAWTTCYDTVLEQLLSSGFQPTEATNPPGFWEDANSRAKEGLTPEARGPALQALASAHEEFAGRLGSVPGKDWDRLTPVVYNEGDAPYDTSPAMLLDWIKDHYLEHVPHAQELLESWRTAGTGAADR